MQNYSSPVQLLACQDFSESLRKVREERLKSTSSYLKGHVWVELFLLGKLILNNKGLKTTAAVFVLNMFFYVGLPDIYVFSYCTLFQHRQQEVVLQHIICCTTCAIIISNNRHTCYESPVQQVSVPLLIQHAACWHCCVEHSQCVSETQSLQWHHCSSPSL